MIHTRSWSSTHTPIVMPRSPLNGFGHNGSTSNIGAVTLEPCASAWFCSTACPTPRPMRAAANATPDTSLCLCMEVLPKWSEALPLPPKIEPIIGERAGAVRAISPNVASREGPIRAQAWTYRIPAPPSRRAGDDARGGVASGRPRDPRRRQAQRLSQTGRQPARAADPGAARRDERGGASDARPGLSRSRARRRASARRGQALSHRQHHHLRERRTAANRAHLAGTRVAAFGSVIWLLRRSIGTPRGSKAPRHHGPLLEPAIPRRAARIPHPVRPLRIRDFIARRPARAEGHDRAALPAARRCYPRVRIPRRSRPHPP